MSAESVPNLRPVVKSASDTFHRKSERDLLPPGRTKSLQPIRPSSNDMKPFRSKSTCSDHVKGIREGILLIISLNISFVHSLFDLTFCHALFSQSLIFN